jgi:TRAP-type C4-dicarboxylate transport system substrate-binding protein
MRKAFLVLLAIVLISLTIGCSTAPSSTTTAAPPKTTAAPTTAPASTAVPATTATPATTAAPPSGKSINIDFISFQNLNDITFKTWKPLFIDKINEKAKGEIVINVRGSTEVIAQNDQAVAIQKGLMQMGIPPTGFMTSTTPGIDSLRLSKLTPQQERDKGLYDYINQYCQTKGLYFIGRQQPITASGFYWINLKKQILKQADFTGLKLGSSGSFVAFFKGIGAVPTTLPITDYYTGLERGVIDGNVGGLNTFVQSALYEVSPYVIDTPFYGTTVTVMMNLNTWNSLSDNMKNLILTTQKEVEAAWPAIHDSNIASLRKQAEDKKTKFYKLDPDVEKWFLDTAYNAAWEGDAKTYPADVVQKIKDLTTK